MARICKVLIVEDDGDVRAVINEMLAFEGYEFLMAADAASMRRLLADDDVDVVIVDVVLPGGESGLALAQELTDQGYGVILVTGHHQHFDRVEQSGHRYLLKPFRMNSLLELVDQVLRETQARCQTRSRRSGAR
jgi:two-component system, OmpR family, response regulator